MRAGLGTGWIAFVSAMPVALVDLMRDELHRGPIHVASRPRSRRRRLADVGVHVLTLACISACVAAVAERDVARSVAAVIAAMLAIAYRRRRRWVSERVELAREQRTDPRGVGRD